MCSNNVFQVLLDELHEQGRLNSMSLWMDLFLIITQDLRFGHMLGQAGRCKSWVKAFRIIPEFRIRQLLMASLI